MFFSLLTLCQPLQASPDLFPELWARAEARRLWDDPQWFTLGHYHRTLWLRVESRIDDPRFFLAPNGKTDRRAELKATLRAFTREDPAEAAGERGIACRFPARRRWLLEVLNLPDTAFAVSDCESYARALEQLKLTRATLVYPSAYMNSPASMFGHLLLVIDRGEKNRLLSRAVNYAALVEDSFGPLFAFKGIFGLYDGVFAILPYYEKVEEYSAVNRRDIWEYPLLLDEDGFDRLLRHVWELQDLRSRYFFFKENCAFNLLYTVEAAQPGLNFTRGFRPAAIPVSLLRELHRSGVLGEAEYRPSKASVMDHLAARLTPAGQRRALELARGSAEIQESDEALVLALAVEIAQFDYTERRVDPEQYRARLLPLLRSRSARGRSELPPVPPPPSPEQSHAPRRMQLYAGIERGGGALAGLRLRAAYHGLLDPPHGYTAGSAITFLETDLRASRNPERVEMRELTLIDIRSLTPHSPWASPLSWSVNFRVEEAPLQPEHHRSAVTFASGRTWSALRGTLVYAMFESTVLHDTALSDNLAWEPGVNGGAVHLGDRFRAGIHAYSRYGLLGDSGAKHRADAELQWTLSPELSLGGRISRFREQNTDGQEILLFLGRTF